MFRRILLPTDGSEGAGRATRHAASLATAFDAHVHVLYVVEPPRFHEYGGSMAITTVMNALEEAGQTALSETADQLRDAGVAKVATQLEQGHPAEHILQYAADQRIDLIVMGTHGRRGLNRMLLGSITEEVVRSSRIPVLTVRMPSETD